MKSTYLQSIVHRCCLLILLWSLSVSGQYFGRNKVQYEKFEFKIINTEHFQVYFYPKESDAAHDAAQMLERWYLRYVNLLHYELSDVQPVVIYANHADFQQTNVISGLIPQGTGGVTEGLKNRIVLPFTASNSENNHVLGHELVHAFQYDVMKKNGQGLKAGQRMPLWFVEGMAEYLSNGREGRLTSMWMRDAVLNDDLPSIKQISRNYKYFPYRYGHALWAYLGGTYGDDMIPSIYNAVMGNGWNQAVEDLWDIKTDSLSKNWQGAIREKYEPQLVGRTKPKDVGDALFTGEGGMNLSPVLSPDGNYFVFLSRKDIFTLDLYMAETATGKIIKKLVSAEADPHFDALRFMSSAGAWSPDSKSLAFVVYRKGDNALAILDVESGDIRQTVSFANVDALTYVAWAPDGEHLVIAGSVGGIGNLYRLDLETESLEPITNDRFSEIQPTWSSDGRYIAYVTDRNENTDLDYHEYGPMQIAVMDVETGDTQLVGLAGASKHINPQFGPENKDLYFIADPDGFSDIYRYSFEEKKFYRITKVATGISGLTEQSPAMSYAKSGQLVFSVFDNTNYNIYSLSGDRLIGTAFTDSDSLDMILPPNNDPNDTLAKLLHKKQVGFQPNPGYEVDDYNPKLELLYIGQTGVGVVVNRFGTGIGGGVNMLFSDLLGNHVLSAVAQVNGTLKDLGGQAIYQNRKSRINWGGGVSHIPYRTGRVFTSPDTVTIDGDQYVAQDVTIVQERQFYDQASLIGVLPLNKNQRFEASTGYTRISFDVEAITQTMLGGQIYDEKTNDLEASDPINLFQTSLAFVGDYSYQGFTSPVRGTSYRLEVEPTIGDIRYLMALVDYRHYFFLDPVTFAFRGMHYGRYWSDERQRLSPLFLGYRTWVRGYAADSFTSQECAAGNQNGRCPAVDRLIGTRVALLNAELRLPLFGNEQYGLFNFQYLPTELLLFADAGVAWTGDEPPNWTLDPDSHERTPVTSAGAAVRVNLFGYLVLQWYYAYPFQRPEKGAHFGFVIAPGW